MGNSIWPMLNRIFSFSSVFLWRWENFNLFAGAVELGSVVKFEVINTIRGFLFLFFTTQVKLLINKL